VTGTSSRPAYDRIAQLELETRQKKITDHIRDKYVKRDIKLKHNSMNIIAYRARHKKLVAPLEPAPRVGR
jgi:hypothetical protein